MQNMPGLCILMQAYLTHGSLTNVTFVKRTCVDFKFIERALSHSHRDAAYHEKQHWRRRISLALWKVAKIYTFVWTQEKSSEQQKKILTSVVKTVLFCDSNSFPLRGHSTYCFVAYVTSRTKNCIVFRVNTPMMIKR